MQVLERPSDVPVGKRIINYNVRSMEQVWLSVNGPLVNFKIQGSRIRRTWLGDVDYLELNPICGTLLGI